MNFLMIALAWAEAPIEIRRSPVTLNVRSTANVEGNLRGQIMENESFAVFEHVVGPGCQGDGWGRVVAEGFTCLENTTVTLNEPVALPLLSTFTTPPMVPYIYGKRWKGWHGKVWKDVESWLAGEPSIDTLDLAHAYSFVSFLDTEKGRVFIRPNGSVVPDTEVFIFPVSVFHGRDLILSPLPMGMAAAWVVGTGGAWLRTEPAKSGDNPLLLPYQRDLTVMETPVGEWWEVPNALGKGLPGYISDSMIRHWVSQPRPAEVGAEEIWLDVDVDQQMLALMKGDVPIYITLISSGKAEHDTPLGIFRIYDKKITNDMNSLADSDTHYAVDDVPWVIHFKPRYALHATFWHGGFGNYASQGCINLSPQDAHYIFDHILPILPDGFSAIYSTPTEVETLIRIRKI